MAIKIDTVGQLISALSEHNPNTPIRVRRGHKLVGINDIIPVIDIDNSKNSSICIWIKED